MNLTQQRFLGFQNTPFLWNNELLGLEQFKITDFSQSIDVKIEDSTRLGNYIERLVSYQLQQQKNIQIIDENIQIIHNKIILGEIDSILFKDNQPIHLEVAYKFYLYDPTVGTRFLEHWIGPNRRDSLLLKLNKIREKQFPLIYTQVCRHLLESLNLEANCIQQCTYFKAQLFIPYKQHIDFPFLNQECLTGYYIYKNQLNDFQNCKFYLPKKLDWIISPHERVDWLNFDKTKIRIQEFHNKKSAPLCWVKQANGEILKLFVVWWEK